MTKHIHFSPSPAEHQKRQVASHLRSLLYLVILAVTCIFLLRTMNRVPALAEFSERAELRPLMEVSLRLGEAWERSVATAPSVIARLRSEDWRSYVRDMPFRPEDLNLTVQDIRLRLQAQDWSLHTEQWSIELEEWRLWPLKQIANIESGLIGPRATPP